MLKATRVLPSAQKVTDALLLPFEKRQKSRLLTRLESGRELLLQLPRGHVLRHGTLLELSDGTAARVQSAPEPLSRVTSNDALALCRAAYHLGNRHVALQIERVHLYYLHDHVLDDMLRELGLEPELVTEPFEPEGGAYSGGHAHAH